MSHNNYIQNKIGEGGCAIVYTQKIGNEIVVCKEMKDQSNNNIKIKDEEIKKLQKLDHPNIVKYLGYCRTIILMEYWEGKDLYSFVITQKMQLPIKFKYKIILQIAEALKYIHEQNIIHCDIKSKNILFDKKYDPDIGLMQNCVILAWV